MRRVVNIVMIGVITVLVYDAVTAAVSLGTGIAYTWFAIGSTGIAILFGFIAARRSQWYVGVVVGAVLGLVDSTLGWAISWSIGPGRPEPDMSSAEILFVIIFVTFETAVLGLVGGLLSLIKRT